MTTAAMTLAAVLAIAVVLLVARPFLVRFREDGDATPVEDAAEVERLRLLEERDRALGALKDLEFDHRTGKISDEDYGRAVGTLRSEAAAVLSALAASEAEAPSGEVPAEPGGGEEQAASTPRRSGS